MIWCFRGLLNRSNSIFSFTKKRTRTENYTNWKVWGTWGLGDEREGSRRDPHYVFIEPNRKRVSISRYPLFPSPSPQVYPAVLLITSERWSTPYLRHSSFIFGFSVIGSTYTPWLLYVMSRRRLRSTLPMILGVIGFSYSSA
jgi:hypothetical protein